MGSDDKIQIIENGEVLHLERRAANIKGYGELVTANGPYDLCLKHLRSLGAYAPLSARDTAYIFLNQDSDEDFSESFPPEFVKALGLNAGKRPVSLEIIARKITEKIGKRSRFLSVMDMSMPMVSECFVFVPGNYPLIARNLLHDEAMERDAAKAHKSENYFYLDDESVDVLLKKSSEDSTLPPEDRKVYILSEKLTIDSLPDKSSEPIYTRFQEGINQGRFTKDDFGEFRIKTDEFAKHDLTRFLFKDVADFFGMMVYYCGTFYNSAPGRKDIFINPRRISSLHNPPDEKKAFIYPITLRSPKEISTITGSDSYWYANCEIFGFVPQNS